jgi:hypothetical protein
MPRRRSAHVKLRIYSRLTRPSLSRYGEGLCTSARAKATLMYRIDLRMGGNETKLIWLSSWSFSGISFLIFLPLNVGGVLKSS